MPADAFAALDDPSEWCAFGRALDTDPQGRWESHVTVDGLRCASCALTLESALTRVPGVERAEVNAASGRARVIWHAATVHPARWFEASSRLGYELTPELGHAARRDRQRADRRVLWRWLVATLCMMQVMMYAWPTYITAPGEIRPDILSLLRWASWVLTLPVLFFACGPFFSQSWRDLRERRVGMDLPVAVGIAITFAVSSIATFDPSGPLGADVYFDSLTMFVFFLLSGRWLEARLRSRSADTIERLMNRLPESVERCLPEGGYLRVPVSHLRVGDQVRVLPGEAFPGDGRIVAGRTSIDEALLTGESRPLARAQGGAVLAGSHNLAAPVEVRIDALGADTRFGQISALIRNAAVSKPRVARLADRVAGPFLLAVLALAVLAALWWWPTDPGRAVMIAVSVLIVTCPCALSMATPAAMLAAAAAFARRGVLLKDLHAVEALASVDTLIFDKTGTLTHGGLQLASIDPVGMADRGQALSLAVALASRSLHPASRALSAAWQAAQADASGAQDGLPARSQNGMSTPAWRVADAVEHPGEGIEAWVDRPGSGEPARRLRLGSAAFCGFDPDGHEGVRACLSDERGPIAVFRFTETLRADADDAIARLRRQHVDVRLLSGDQQSTVQALADRLRLPGRGDCTPEDKLAEIGQLQAQGHQVAMVGDGLNDAPVLAHAHVAIAMGQAVPLARAQADLVLLGEALDTIPAAIAIARRAVAIVQQNLTWAVLYNVVAVPLAAAGRMPPWLAGLGMAASSLLVVLNAARLARPTAAAQR